MADRLHYRGHFDDDDFLLPDPRGGADYAEPNLSDYESDEDFEGFNSDEEADDDDEHDVADDGSDDGAEVQDAPPRARMQLVDVDGMPVEIEEIVGWRSPLFRAAARGEVAEVARLLLEGVDPSEHDGKAFWIACKLGFEAVAEQMLADPRVALNLELTVEAVAAAATSDRLPVLELLLTDERVRISEAVVRIAIHECASGRAMARILADARFQPGWIAGAARYCRSEPFAAAAIEQLLLHPGAGDLPTDTVSHIFSCACCAGSSESVRVAHQLLDHPHLHATSSRWPALVDAVSSGHVELVDRMLRDPRTDPMRCPQLIEQAMTAGPEVIGRLIDDPRINPCASQVLLLTVIRNEHVPLMGRLLHDPRYTPAHQPLLEAVAKAVVTQHRDAGSGKVALPSAAARDVYNRLFSHPLLRRFLSLNTEQVLRLGHIGTVDLLLTDAAFSASMSKGRIHEAALVAAAAANRNDLVDRILADKRAPRLQRAQKAALLCTAAQEGNLELLSRMLADADVDAAQCAPKAVHAVVDGNRYDCVSLVLGHPRFGLSALGDGTALELLKRSCDSGCEQAARALLADPRHLHEAGDSITLHSVVNSCVKVKTEGLWDATVRDRVARDEAARVAIMELLLDDPRVDAAAGSNAALKCACEQGLCQAAALLLTLPSVWRGCVEANVIRYAVSGRGRAAGGTISSRLAAVAAAQAWRRRRAAVLAFMAERDW